MAERPIPSEIEPRPRQRTAVIGIGTLGEGLVQTLLEEPRDVLALDINSKHLENLTSESDKGALYTQQADLHDTEGIIETLKVFGPIDRLYLTVCPPQSHGGLHFWEEPRDRIIQLWKLNVLSLGLFLHAISQKDSNVLAKGARVGVLSSGNGLEKVPAPFEAIHTAEARCIAGLVDSLQVELDNSEDRKQEGIKYFLFFPGPIIAANPKKDVLKPMDPSIAGGEDAKSVARKIIAALDKGKKRHTITDIRVAAFVAIEPILSTLLGRKRVEQFAYKTKKKIIDKTRDKRNKQL